MSRISPKPTVVLDVTSPMLMLLLILSLILLLLLLLLLLLMILLLILLMPVPVLMMMLALVCPRGCALCGLVVVEWLRSLRVCPHIRVCALGAAAFYLLGSSGSSAVR
jgi:hypothetical protein